MLGIELSERGMLPDPLMRWGMRRLMAERLENESRDRGEREFAEYQKRLQALRDSAVAEQVDKANEQHYEVPAPFFRAVLGKHLKYSACYWEGENGEPLDSLEDAEARMLAITCARAGLKDGQDVLELGCGWGSITLWMASHYPGSRITAVSNSASQREYILAECERRGLDNVKVVTADVNAFQPEGEFDRVVSVEMIEHVKNYQVLLRRIASWLRPGGKLFVHIFCHRTLLYPFTVEGESDWMAKYFFSGGLMPSENTLLNFQDDLHIEAQWRVLGKHYERTSNAWLANLDERHDEVLAVMRATYGDADAKRWLNRWRMFFLAVAELFGYRGGTEWFVAHYRFARRD